MSGNADPAFYISGGNQNSIQGNLIGLAGDGVSPLPNAGDGARMFSGIGSAILGNGIYSNALLGIDLVGGTENTLGVTDNDSCDSDSGAKVLQNNPVLTSASLAPH